MQRLLISASAAALFAAQPVTAQDTFDLGEITVFSNQAGTETELERTGVSVEVLTEDDIKRAPETKASDALSNLPGVSTSANGPLGTTTTLRIRGLDGKYIKVLINGIDVTDPAAPQTSYNWGNLTTSNLSRIELLKGSSSAIYGSRAIAGVVNINTVQATEPGTTGEVVAEAGSFDTYRFGAAVANRTEYTTLTFSIDRVESDGFSARDGAANTEDDGFKSTQLTFSAEHQTSETFKLGFSAYYLDAEGNFDEFGGDGAPPFDEFNETEQIGLRAFGELQTGAVQHTVSASWFESDRLSSSNGTDSIFLGDRLRADYTGVYARSEVVTYTFGADWERESFESGVDEGEVDTTGVFGEVLYAANSALDLSAALRYDNHSDFGSNVSGRLAAAYRPDDATVIRAVASTGFRAPSLFELNSTDFGNPNLDPEESVSFELGVERQLGAGSFLKATAFYTEIDDLIQFVTLTSFPAPFTGQYQQVPGTSVSKGIELSGEMAISQGISLFGSYTYTDTEDADGDRLLRVPAHDFVLGLGTDLSGPLNGQIVLNYVADRPDDSGTVMEDYTVVNGALFYDINETAQIYLRVENLFDEEYQTAAGFSASDRAAYFGVRARF